MVDEKKVKLMTKLAIYEQKEQHRAVPMSKFYKSDYVRYNVLKTWVAATVVYWSVFAVYIYMNFENVLIKINEIDYFKVIYNLLGGYVAFCLIYYLFASFVYNYRYSKCRRGLAKYNGNLKKLIAYEKGEPEDGIVGEVINEDEDFLVDDSETERKELINQARQSSRVRVSRSELIKQAEAEKQKAKEQEIIENVRRRNERISMQNEAILNRQKQAELDKKRIQERRKQLEQQQLEKLRQERMQQMARQNHYYNQSANQEGSDR